jgi:CRISPR-associated protein Csc3
MSDAEMTQDYLYIEEEPGTFKPEPIELAAEPLFAVLLRGAVAKLWPDDPMMADFVTHVAGPLSDQLAGVGAKGGDFALRMQAEGKDVEHYSRDQSQRAHLVNGLFPALHVARTLRAWGAPQVRDYDEATRRLFVAGYVLHDFLKLPGVGGQLAAAGFGHDTAVGAAQMDTLEAIFHQWCATLGLDAFLGPLGGPEAVLHDLIYVACNTQTRWGTLRNLSLLKRLTLAPPQLDLAEQLSRLADLLAYVARTPQAVPPDATLCRELTQLSNGIARFTCHHLADNRGLLTNFIQEAALGLMQRDHRVPLLYAPSGVVYLEHKETAPPLPTAADVAQAAIRRIQEIIGTELQRTRSGMKRDGKGMKYAEFYWLFFDLPTFIRLGVQATFDVIHGGKNPSSGKRFAKMRNRGWMAPEVDLDLPDDVRADQLAEWCYLAEKQVAAQLPEFDTAGFLLQALELEGLREQFEAVPRDNRAGGVGYHWYFAAGHYLKRHRGLDPAAWQERVEGFARELSRAVADVPQPEADAGTRTDWDDLQDYVAQTLTLGAAAGGSGQDAFAAELDRYTNAKRRGRGTTQMCALCSSPYRVDKQQEAAVLFAPQVYSNKQPLHGTDALRSICTVCGVEMMLRQLLMNRSAATGGDFEGQRVRYLYFYPTYFFTPETLAVLRQAYLGLQKISFTELRRQLVREDGTVDVSPKTLQRLEPLLLTPEEEVDPAKDRHVRFHFAETEPVTFYFFGLKPPGRDVKDAESWVHPAFLALLLPLCLDVKVVASESSLPLLLEADEIAETVFLDGPHAAIRYLTGGEMRVNVDQVLPTLQRLAIGYLIHLDANSGMGRGGFDYRWQNIPALARDLDSSPLYAFHYLKKWQRQQGMDTLPGSKVRQYLDYVQTYLEGGNAMSYARELTRLYRQFYRASRTRLSAHNVLRPLAVAARAVLDADPRLFADAESLVEAVYGELHARIEGAAGGRQFYFPRGSNGKSREQAMRAFADTFVRQVFQGALRGDKSALRGKQLNLLRNACEVIYHEMEAQERATSADNTSSEE